MLKVDEGKIRQVLQRAGLSTRRIDEISRLLATEIVAKDIVEVVKEVKTSARKVTEVMKEE